MFYWSRRFDWRHFIFCLQESVHILIYYITLLSLYHMLAENKFLRDNLAGNRNAQGVWNKQIYGEVDSDRAEIFFRIILSFCFFFSQSLFAHTFVLRVFYESPRIARRGPHVAVIKFDDNDIALIRFISIRAKWILSACDLHFYIRGWASLRLNCKHTSIKLQVTSSQTCFTTLNGYDFN